MEKVMVIGCGGSGKTTLSRELGEITGLPVVHLDQIWWSPGDWQHITREEFDERIAEEVEKPRWILDGNFNRTIETRLEKCDTVVYLDLPRLTCLCSWLGRVIRNWGIARADMAPGCAEWFDPEMAGWIWRFNKENRTRYYALLSRAKAQGKTVYILKSRRQVKLFRRSVRKGLA